MLKPRVTLLLIFKCVVEWCSAPGQFHCFHHYLASEVFCKSETLGQRCGSQPSVIHPDHGLWHCILSSVGTACLRCTQCACRQIPVLLIKRGGRDVGALCSFSNSPLLASTVPLAFCLYEFDFSSTSHEWGHYSTRAFVPGLFQLVASCSIFPNPLQVWVFKVSFLPLVFMKYSCSICSLSSSLVFLCHREAVRVLACFPVYLATESRW